MFKNLKSETTCKNFALIYQKTNVILSLTGRVDRLLDQCSQKLVSEPST